MKSQMHICVALGHGLKDRVKENEAETERKAKKRAESMCEGLADSAINTVGSGGGQEKSMAFSTVLSGIRVLCLDCDLIN